jgi:UDPglucose--hexose-1-phosphate uridylyltransferase
MHAQRLTKADGRRLVLYAHEALPVYLEAPIPVGAPPTTKPHMRWHPLRGEWVLYAGYVASVPAIAQDLLAPTTDVRRPTELPAGPWEMAVFESLHPWLVPEPQRSASVEIPEREAARGVSEVLVYHQSAKAHLAMLSLPELELLFGVWADRTAELGARRFIQYVMPFENRGIEAGATTGHPHGRIEAFGFVPPVPAEELLRQAMYLEATGRGLVSDLVEEELRDGRRVLYDDGVSVAFVPAFARRPYEVWIVPRASLRRVDELDAFTRGSLARALKSVLQRYEGLWSRPFPYVMALHQAPTDGQAHPEAHLHLEFLPPLVARDRAQVPGGAELGAGAFMNDVLPEDAAAALRAVALSDVAALR